MKLQLTTYQAMKCLPKKDKISVMVQGYNTYQEFLWGANDIKVAFSNSHRIRISTGVDRMHGHGIEVVASDTNRRYDMLFIEHDEQRLNDIEQKLGAENGN